MDICTWFVFREGHPVLVLCVVSVVCSVLVHGFLLCLEFVEYSSLHFLSLGVVFNFSVVFLLLSVDLMSSQAHILTS